VQLSVQGATIRGEVAAIREDALVLDVKSTSDAKAYPKGNATVPRGPVSMLRLQRERPSRSLERAGVRCLYAVDTTADWNNGGEVLAMFVVVAGAVAVAVYFVGRELDSGTTEIRVVP